jgi:hypothetical protein
MGHILRCRVIPKDEVHPQLWVGANRKWRPVPRDRLARVQHNKVRTVECQQRESSHIVPDTTDSNGGEHPQSRKPVDETSEGAQTQVGRSWYKIRLRCCCLRESPFRTCHIRSDNQPINDRKRNQRPQGHKSYEYLYRSCSSVIMYECGHYCYVFYSAFRVRLPVLSSG